MRIVLKGSTTEDIERRLAIFNDLRVPRVKTVIEYTREMAPKKAKDKEINHKTTQTYSDYYWRYKITSEAVRAMNKHGFKMTLVNPATGDISLA